MLGPNIYKTLDKFGQIWTSFDKFEQHERHFFSDQILLSFEMRTFSGSTATSSPSVAHNVECIIKCVVVTHGVSSFPLVPHTMAKLRKSSVPIVFKLVQTCSNLFKLVQTRSNSFKLVQTCSNLFKLVQTCSNLFKQVQSGSNLFKLLLL